MINKIYLKNPCSDVEVRGYIFYMAKENDSDIHLEVENELHKIITRILEENFGKNWEKILIEYPEIKNSIHYCQYSLSTRLVNDSAGDVYPNDDFPYYGYSSIRSYPYFEGFYKQILPEEFKLMSNILIQIEHSRRKIYKDLISSGIIDKDMNLIPETYGELKMKCPNLFDWYIFELIKKKGWNRITVISETEDLNNLKSWIPSVMI